METTTGVQFKYLNFDTIQEHMQSNDTFPFHTQDAPS